MSLRKIVGDEIRSNVITSIWSCVTAVMTGVGFSIGAVLQGWDIVGIALAGLGAFTFVVVLAVSLGVAHHHGWLRRRYVRGFLKVALAVLFIAASVWFVGLLGEVRDLRTDVSEARKRGIENPEHEERLRRGTGFEDELNRTRPALARALGQNDLLTAQLTMATTRINDLEEILNQRGRISRTRVALAKSQNEGLALRKSCSSTNQQDYLVKLQQWIDGVTGILKSNGWASEAVRWVTPLPTPSVTSAPTPDCGPMTQNRQAARGLNVYVRMIDEIANGLGR